jgi:dTDP-4-dehydrorhamnose 3,5-epimerase
VNFPTIQYDHSAPDKWRLSLDTPLIPYRFPPGTSGG